MWRPALAEQIGHHQQQAAPHRGLTEEITTMSHYGDFEFVRAETEYRLERGRPAGWIASRGRGALRRRPTRRPSDALGNRHPDAA